MDENDKKMLIEDLDEKRDYLRQRLELEVQDEISKPKLLINIVAVNPDGKMPTVDEIKKGIEDSKRALAFMYLLANIGKLVEKRGKPPLAYCM